MKRVKWQIILGLLLVLLSALLYLIHYLIFKDAYQLLFYLFLNIVYLPIEVLLVTMVIQGMLNTREKRSKLEKMNMVIEVFFSEVGLTLLKHFFDFDANSRNIRENFMSLADWSNKDYSRVRQNLLSFDYKVSCETGDLEQMRVFLLEKRDFLLRLLENPNLLEHESFTDLLWAVFHLTEELAHRHDCRELHPKDLEHFGNDIKRGYVLLMREWLGYMRHLKNHYPYLFSLAVRINPFDPNASAEIKG